MVPLYCFLRTQHEVALVVGACRGIVTWAAITAVPYPISSPTPIVVLGDMHIRLRFLYFLPFTHADTRVELSVLAF